MGGPDTDIQRSRREVQVQQEHTCRGAPADMGGETRRNSRNNTACMRPLSWHHTYARAGDSGEAARVYDHPACRSLASCLWRRARIVAQEAVQLVLERLGCFPSQPLPACAEFSGQCEGPARRAAGGPSAGHLGDQYSYRRYTTYSTRRCALKWILESNGSLVVRKCISARPALYPTPFHSPRDEPTCNDMKRVTTCRYPADQQ